MSEAGENEPSEKKRMAIKEEEDEKKGKLWLAEIMIQTPKDWEILKKKKIYRRPLPAGCMFV